MEDDQLLRYARHVLLDAWGVEAQEALAQARVLVVGAGGLGSPAAMFLVAAGVGELVLADDDTVDLTNLQRQLLHTTASVGQRKVDSAAERLSALNPEPRLTLVAERLVEGPRLRELVDSVDLVLDCTDNFEIRVTLNRLCVAMRTPLVSGAAVRFSGQVTLFDPRDPASPCYACLFPEEGDEVEAASCAILGVFAPLVGIIGSMQAAEALKLLGGGIGTSLAGRLLTLDALSLRWRERRVVRDPGCPVCGHRDHA